MRKSRIFLNAVSRKIPDSLSEDRLIFSSAGAQPISLKSFRGLGYFPNKIARVYKHEHCLPSAFRSWQVMRSGYRCALLARMVSSGVGTHRICLLFRKEIPVVPRRISQVYIHLLCLLFCKFSRWQVQRFSQVGPHLICLLFSVSHVSKRHFPNGSRRQPPPCLPKSETDGRKSMAAQPFILTIDGVRPFCYAVALERI